MVLRAPYETAERSSWPNRSISVDLDRLAAVVRDANGPVAIQTLARAAARAMVVADGPLRTYVPGRTYEPGERLRLLDGRLGDIVALEPGENPVQGSFDIISVRLRDGETIRLASHVVGAPMAASPELISDETVDMLLLGQEQEMVRHVRQSLAADPRFITLYYGDGEYGCLREFFPPMSPDVLDAALALLLDELFDQIPLSRIKDTTATAQRASGARRGPAEPLFTAASLDGALASGSDWQETGRSSFEAVRSLWLRADRHRDSWDATQLASVFLQPLLRALGWSSVPLPSSEQAPDNGSGDSHCYALCADPFSASELYIHYDGGDSVSNWALALVQATAWEGHLDQPSSPGAAGMIGSVEGDMGAGVASPAHQLIGHLRQTDVRWGIVTNGRVWRLVSRDANSFARAYYEVDLGQVFDGLAAGETPDRERWEVFRRWWLLFRQASYVPGRSGQCLLAHLRDREPQAERQTRSLLRERLLTRALPAVAGGFVAYRRQRLGIGVEQPSTLAEIYRASVLFLARVLFILIAEARDLLPLSDADYRPHSLTTQAQWATERARRHLPLSRGVYTTARYDIVLALLHRVAKGDADKNLPTYGRLFFNPSECDEHRFLERTRLSDQSLAQALDAVFRGIDYTTLDARDLIGVCSALVGSQLSVIDADAGEVLITRQGNDRVRAETLPDFVVTSAVEQALGPVLSARSEMFSNAMADVVSARRRLRRTLDRRRRSALHTEWERASRSACDAILGIRVCDPAMGAGDFLLSAVDVLTDGIIACLQAYHRDHPDVPRDWNPVYRLLDGVAQDVAEEMARQDVAVAPQMISDTLILSRLVAQRTVFGVADDDQAVEVAKSGLWLHTFAAGAPLSFLDHHLRSGNALIGAHLTEVAKSYGLASVLEEASEDARTLYALTDRVDAGPLDVRWSAAQFERTEDALAPYRRLLDVAVSSRLGMSEAADVLGDLDPIGWRSGLEKGISFGGGAEVAGAGYFHWDLAFPEVYVDLATGVWQDRPGFDVVLGAPPWTVTQNEAVTAYLEKRFLRPEEAYNKHHGFLSLARTLVRRPGGRTAFVLSREWLASPTGGI